MKNTVKSNFSLRKLILTALVAGPVAILPAPLWALPSTAATNLTTSTGVSVVSAGTALNITSPDKGVLTWVNFGSGTDTIANGDTLNYILPSSSASVLNLVSGGVATTINGALVSNGNVYLMNPSGIVIGSGATVNVGGFYASAVNESLAASYFQTTGTLSYVGTGNGSVTVSHTDATGGKLAPVIQAVGSGNNIILAGGSAGTAVDVQMGSVFGNLTTRSTGGNIALASGGAVNVSGNLVVNSNGGNVDLSKAGTAGTPGALALTGDGVTLGAVAVTNGGSGYAPSSTVAITFDLPKVTNNGYTQTVYGTQATGSYTTDSTGKITGFTVLTAGSGYAAAPTYTSFGTPTAQTLNVGGTLNVTTGGGSLSNNTDNRVTATGATTLNTAGTTSWGTTSLPNVDFSTLNLSNVGLTTVNDQVGGIALGNGTVNASTAAATQLSITSSASSSNISMASGAKITVNPSATNLTPEITLNASKGSLSYTGVGAMTFTAITSSTTNTATISGDKDITIKAVSTRGLTVTTSGGSITTAGITGGSTTTAAIKLAATGLGDITYNSNSLYTSGTVDIQASNGKVTIGTLTAGGAPAATLAMSIGGSSIIKASGDVTINAPLAATSGATIQSTGGQVSLTGSFAGQGTISAATNVTLSAVNAAAAAADISGGTTTMSSLSGNSVASGSVLSYALSTTSLKLGAGYNPNSNYDVTFSTPTGGGAVTATGYATTDSAGRFVSVTITNPGAGYTTAATVALAAGSVATNSIVANGTLAITATNGTITIPGTVKSNGTLSLTSGQTLSLASDITAPTLNLTSTGSNISQTAGSIVSTSKTTISAATTASLDSGSPASTNDFNQIVVTNTAGGATIADKNNLVIGGGTDAKGDLVVKVGQTAASQVVAIAAPTTLVTTNGGSSQNLTAIAGTNTVAGTVTGATLPTSTGYAPNTQYAITFSAPPTVVNAPNITTAGVFSSTSAASTTGWVFNNGGISKVVFAAPLGNGYTPKSQVAVTFNAQGAGFTTAPTGYATVNDNGQISSITITNPGSGVSAATLASISFGAANGGAAVTATGYAISDASGKLGTVVITEPGNGYVGLNVPTASIGVAGSFTNSAATGTTATAAGANAASTTVNVTAGGSNYSAAPVVTMTNGATATATIAGGAVTNVYSSPIGTVALGSASTDTIKVGGNLTITSSSPSGTITTGATTTADNAVVSTVANSVNVTGTISATNNGAAVTFGNAAPIGTTTSYNFGGVAASIGAGNLTVNSNGALALGTITAGNLTAKSITGDITNTGAVTLTAGATLTSKDIFAPGNITLGNAGNNIAGTIVVTNAKDFTLTNTNNTVVQAGSAAIVGAAMTGVTSVTTSAGKTLTFNVAGGGDYGVISFNAGGAVTLTNDPNGVTIRNATNTGNGNVSITANGPINLDSGITLNGTGTTTFNATGANGTIADTAAGIAVYGAATFNSSNNISISKAGHSFGAVTLNSGVGGAATNADIVYTENGTANLAGVTVLAGTAAAPAVSITSTSGGILQSGAGVITVPAVLNATTQSANFSAATGVTLGNNNVIAVPVSITGGADSSIVNNAALTLGNVRVNGGTFTVNTSGSILAGGAVAQAAGTALSVYGNTSVTTRGSAITLANSGNNFGALTLSSVGNGAVLGADIALTEGSTLNVNAVNAGTTGKIALSSENANIIQTTTGTGLTGGTAATAAISLTAAKGNITLNSTNNSNGAPITLSTTGSATLVDSSATFTKLASGTSVTGATNLRNTSGTATLADISGGLLLNGAVMIDMTGAAAMGNISITGSGNSFGAVQFRAGNVTISEDKTLNLAAGSMATGTAILSSLADIVTSGAGTSYFSGPATSLTLNAGGNITIKNPLTVYNGLSFRALGAVDLSALSISANLNGKTPTSYGHASYIKPQD